MDSLRDVSKGEPVFVKSSSRSPKDATIAAANFRDTFLTKLEEKGRPSDDNEKVKALLETSVEMFKSTKATQVIETFASSQRIRDDMTLALEQIQRFHEHFVVRRWVNIAIDMEFVNKGELTALSQYNHPVFFERLTTLKEALERRILQFWESAVAPRIIHEFPSCVVDFAIEGDDPLTGQLYVIEINPFQESTDAALFSWGMEKDKLENGPFEFHVRDHPQSGIKASLEIKWRDMLTSKRRC